MPPIVPPPSDLLSAPIPSDAPVVNGAPVAPPATSPVVSSRRLTIYYQDAGTSPVAPIIDAGIDVAQPVLDRLAEYTGERSQINNIPVVGLPIQTVGFRAEQPQQGQQEYVNTIPNVKDEFNRVVTQFDQVAVRPDDLGVNYKADNNGGPRNRYLYLYNRLAINSANASGHEAVVNSTLLATRGHNPANQFVTETISQNKEDNRITLGSFFYKNAGNLSNGVNYATGSYVASQPATATDAPPMTIEQMKDIGLNIMFEAVQGRAGLDFAIRSNDAGDIAEAETRMSLPSEQRIGKRVSLGRFTPAFQIKKLTGVEKPNNSNFIDNTDDIQTYGSQYNVYSQFDSLISIGQIALCVAMILAYVLLLSALTALINAFNLSGDADAQARASSFATLGNNEKKRLLGASVLQNSGVYPLSQVDIGDIASQFLGTNGIFSYTRHRTEECLNAGIQEFFGFSFSGFGTTSGNEGTGIAAGQQLANTSLRVLTESGRLNVILREILRSGISLVEDTALDLTGLASVTGIGNLIRKIRDLKIVRFINVLMGMGDKVKFEFDIRAKAAANINNGTVNRSLAVTGSNTSYVDSLPDTRQNYISKSRLSNQTGLAWSNKTAGMLGLPLVGGANTFNNVGLGKYNRNGFSTHWDEMGLNVGTPANYQSSQITTLSDKEAQSGRISANVVRDVEEALEADFMPFYIHDLRTNEILSFHAFLEEASEDFSVEYTAQDGYGRMDKVQIYKGTTRNVSVNFKMVAMNPEDHDIMWYKVNRLAMMIYPQWTQGRKVTVDNLKFIQPFSQIPGATPVIRLRLGDLYKTNYSKMAVARLFGASTLEDYNVDSQNSPPSTSAEAPAPKQPAPNQTTGGAATRDRAKKMQERAFGTTDSDGGTAKTNTTRGSRSRAATNVPTYQVDHVLNPNDTLVFKVRHFPNLSHYRINGAPFSGNDRSRILAKVTRFGTDESTSSVYVKPEKFIPDVTIGVTTNQTANIQSLQSTPITGVGADEGGAPRPAAEVLMTVDRLNNSDLFDKPNTVNLFNQLATNQDNSIPATAQPDRNATEIVNPTNFYSETDNPVMKAFKSSGGKGLAGVITSFKVDYSEAKGNWGIDTSNYLRAPMFVTVQLQMAVIHDITPGLDSKGIMMAPIWPVGKTSNYFVNNGNIGADDTTDLSSPVATSGPLNGIGNQDANDYFAVDKGTPLYYDRKD